MTIRHRVRFLPAIILIITMVLGISTVSAATRPGKETSEPKEIKYRCEEMHVMNGDIDLYGEMYLPLEEKELYPTVILSHGLGSNGNGMAGQAKLFAENGFAAYVYDINEGSIVSRSGKADKDMTHLTPMTAVSDLEAVVDSIRELPYVDTEHLFLSGASFGGLISAYLSGMRPDEFKGILLQSAAFSIPEEYREQYPSSNEIPETVDVRGMILGRQFIEDACAMDIYSVISNYKGDVLLCHGDVDDTVDISYAEKAAEIYENCKFVVYEGAGHSFAGKFKPVNDEEMLSFLQAHLDEELKVKKLTVTQNPDRTVYETDELFDPAGVVLEAQMSDGTVREDVPWDDYSLKEPLTEDKTYVKFTYGGKSAKVKIRVLSEGDCSRYSAEEIESVSDSPLAGKVIYWLGSSVTYGSGLRNESMVELISAKHGAECIKEAVSGTSLAEVPSQTGGDEYAKRFDAYLASPDHAENVDIFVCQLSTNDMKYVDEYLGEVSADEVRDPAAFDRATTIGAIEYIIATAQKEWDCPIFFYTNGWLKEDDRYNTLVDALYKVQEKWDIHIIDMHSDEAFNDLTEEQVKLYMKDDIHPTLAGYKEWWLPVFEEALYSVCQ